MKARTSGTVIILLVVSILVPAFGDGARIPIWTETVITEPGHYYLTRDIPGSPFGPPIEIASGRVVLDLNGYRVDGDPNAILINPGLKTVTIRNGRASNSSETDGTISAVNVDDLVLENLSLPSVYGIRLDNAKNFAIRNVRGMSGVFITGGLLGVIEDCQFSETANVSGSNIQIRRNLFLGEQKVGLYISGSRISVLDNTMQTSEGGVVGTCTSCFISRNAITVSGNSGDSAIDGTFNGSRIENNLCVGDFGVERNMNGISVQGSRNLIRNNLVEGHATGIEIDGSDNVYGGNVSRGNDVDFVVSGANNSSEGNNFLPTKQ